MKRIYKKKRPQGIKAAKNVGPTLTMRTGVRNLYKAEKK
jgi:hypothetical protein